jgi:hypothetical protein
MQSRPPAEGACADDRDPKRPLALDRDSRWDDHRRFQEVATREHMYRDGTRQEARTLLVFAFTFERRASRLAHISYR